MTTRDNFNDVLPARALQIQTISGSALNTGNIDLQGFESAQVLVDFGDIDELGGSPQGAAKIDVKLEHADDNGSGAPGAYADVTAADVLGPSSVTSGVVASVTTDTAVVRVGYRGERRFIRATVTPTALTNGGPVGIWVVKGHPHQGPVG